VIVSSADLHETRNQVHTGGTRAIRIAVGWPTSRSFCHEVDIIKLNE
jgi:hypothetical protein